MWEFKPRFPSIIWGHTPLPVNCLETDGSKLSKLIITIIVFLLIFGCSKGLSRCLNWTGVVLVIIAVWIVKIISDATLDIFLIFYRTTGVERDLSRSSSPFCFWALHRCSSQCLGATYSRVWNVNLEDGKKVIAGVQPLSSQSSPIVLEPLLVQARHHEMSMTSCTETYNMTTGLFHNE